MTYVGIQNRILSANANGSLLSDLCSPAYVGREDVIDALAALHNSGQIDFPAACRSDQLNSISGHSFFSIQQFFCKTLPRIDCDVRDAMETCAVLFEKAGNDMTAGFVFESLREWFTQRLERTENGLRLIQSTPDVPAGVAHSVLLAVRTMTSGSMRWKPLTLRVNPIRRLVSVPKPPLGQCNWTNMRTSFSKQYTASKKQLRRPLRIHVQRQRFERRWSCSIGWDQAVWTLLSRSF